MAVTRSVIELSRLRPTQVAVGKLHVKEKRRRLRALAKRPTELVDFICEHAIPVVLGPDNKVYLTDHHHLALALIKEEFVNAPMDVQEDLSHLSNQQFWKKMAERGLIHCRDSKGLEIMPTKFPKRLQDLEDDLYRSLAGFVRDAGGFRKVDKPHSEFLWADYFRNRIKKKSLRKGFKKAIKHALKLARENDARDLPGYLKA